MQTSETERIWLKKLRQREGLSQKDVAQRTAISHQFYNYIENGDRNPSVKVAKKIALSLNFDWTLFFMESISSVADSLKVKPVWQGSEARSNKMVRKGKST